jgi:hypothetical protein
MMEGNSLWDTLLRTGLRFLSASPSPRFTLAPRGE